MQFETDMYVRRIMSHPPVVVEARDSVRQVARQMLVHDIGFAPVLGNGRLVGTITDRDLALAALLHNATTCPLRIIDVMSPGSLTCKEDDLVEMASGLMSDHQVRRLPVLNGEGRLVGILSLGDIAEHLSEQLAGEILGEIVERR